MSRDYQLNENETYFHTIFGPEDRVYKYMHFLSYINL